MKTNLCVVGFTASLLLVANALCEGDILQVPSQATTPYQLPWYQVQLVHNLDME